MPSGIGMFSLTSFIEVDSYRRFGMSASSFSPSCSRPFSLMGDDVAVHLSKVT